MDKEKNMQFSTGKFWALYYRSSTDIDLYRIYAGPTEEAIPEVNIVHDLGISKSSVGTFHAQTDGGYVQTSG